METADKKCLLCNHTLFENENRVCNKCTKEKINKVICTGNATLEEKILYCSLTHYKKIKNVEVQKRYSYKTKDGREGEKNIDLAIAASKLHIEVDGYQHYGNANQVRSDVWRSFYAAQEGYLTLRVPNEVFEDKKEYLQIVSAITAIARKRKPWWKI